MPRLLSLRPGAIATGVNVDADLWRLLFGAVAWGEPSVACFSLLYQPATVYVPRFDGQAPYWPVSGDVALLRVPISFAMGPDGVAGLARVAAAANDSETHEICQKRTTEALTLFQNGPRISKDDMASATKRVLELVDAVWDLRAWMAAPTPDPVKTWTVDGAQLVGRW